VAGETIIREWLSNCAVCEKGSVQADSYEYYCAMISRLRVMVGVGGKIGG
jgi:hypothetical protein